MAEENSMSQRVIAGLGGPSNIGGVENCITRLRIPVARESDVDLEGLRAIDGVLGVVPGPTMQVVLGPGVVDTVARDIEKSLASSSSTAEESAPTTKSSNSAAADDGPSSPNDLQALGARMKSAQKEKRSSPVRAFLGRIANIFLPLIPALIACGIVAGLSGVLQNFAANGAWPWAADVVPVLTAISSGFMTLIAVFVGMNAAKEFGGTPVLGGAVAAIIPFAGVAKVSILGTELVPGQGGVIGALFAAILAAYIERWCRKWAPESLAMLIVPTVTVLVAGALTLFPLMTVAGWISTGIGTAATWLLGTGGGFAGFVLAGLFLPLVMLGLHQALIPIHTTLISQAGYTVLLPILAMAGGGQVGATAAVYLRIRNRALRNTIKSALPAGILGVGEPLIYGVTLPMGRPFITACIGGAFGGGFIGLFNQLGFATGSTAIGPSGWALFPLAAGNHGIGAAIAVYGVGLVISYIAGFVLTYFFGVPKDLVERMSDEERTVESAGA
ncbi:PTS transporter subunit EIIC [uncultured Kocuria sp.]|uniref:PTS transporter subunit EIIC n=1 Tax=uncultured Kocuria sp. TaxID=259305 RepID=UPI002596FE8E|nr:PTS transporter subunit EIIC [uncultured Kocuria sp.]MCT1367188.1 PTS transporter subunit EIIC [Rothia sp. p3-SID1597]